MKVKRFFSVILVVILIIKIINAMMFKEVLAVENTNNEVNSETTEKENIEELTSEEINREYEIKEEETWDISENGDGSVIAKWTLSDKTLRISGNGGMKNWKESIQEDWHNSQYTNLIERVIIEEGVTEIESDAFSGCSSLTNIEIPEGVTKIGIMAFSECSSLKNIEIPGSVTIIGTNAFQGCSSLISIDVDTNNRNYMIENGILFDKERTTLIKCPARNKDMKEYEIPERVTCIESYAFEGCSSLTSIKLPQKLIRIDSGTFEGCSSLANIEIPEGVMDMGRNVFSGCISLTSINIPEGVIRLGSDLFSGCISLKNINIPEGVKYIEYSVFSGCSNLRSVRIPQNIIRIDNRAFEDSTILYVKADSVGHKYAEKNDIGYILNGEASIVSTEYEIKEEETWDISENGDGSVIAKWRLKDKTLIISGTGKMKSFFFEEAWRNSQYTNLIKTVVINEGITKIGDYAFSGCSNLTSVNIPEGVTEIGNSAFSECSSLKSIEIPESVTSMAIGAFKGCSSLISIDVDTNNRNYMIENGILFDKEGTTLIKCPARNKDMKEYEIPERVTCIESYAFEGCSDLTSINIPEGVIDIENNAFQGCSNLTSINIPEGVIDIEWYAFSGCSSLTSINIPESVKEIKEQSFSGCSSLTSINIPEGVIEIGNYAFSGCSNLTSVNIPEGVTRIGDKAFAECSSIKNIIIKDTVTEIGSAAIDKGTIIYTKSNAGAQKYAEKNKQGYIIDNEAPTVILTSNGNNNLQKAHNVKVIITDNKEKVGVKNSSLKYQWTQSKEQPTKESFTESFENNQTLTKNTGDGEWYLWIYAEDNLNNEKIVRSEAFYFDNTSPVLSIKYSTKKPTKENIIVTITANEEIQEVEGWNLSTDKKQLTKEYVQNVEETITIKDIVGNAVKQTIKVDNIDKIAPKIEIKYSTKEQTRGKVKVEIVADEELQGAEGWILSADKKILSKEFDQNIQEAVTIKDLAGNETKQTITIDNIDKTAPEVEVSYSTKEETEGNVTVEIKANEELQILTGWNLSIDKKKLTREYSRNTKETVTVKDIAGNEKQVEINIQNIKKPIKIGDINADSKIDITDVILLKRHLIAGNRTNWILTGDNLEAADMNENEKVDISDLLLLKREVAQNI